MVEEIKIKKSDIFSEQEICSGRKMILLKNGKKFIGNIEIQSKGQEQFIIKLYFKLFFYFKRINNTKWS